MHRLVSHQHDATPHCEAGDSDTHIHGEEFLVQSCIVCCFQFSPSEQAEVVLPIITAPFVVQNISPFAYLSLPESVILTSPPRGPPTRFV